MKGSLRLFCRLIHGVLLDRGGLRVPLTPRRLAVTIVFLPVFLAVQILHWIGFLLDDVFFRSYRDVEVREPVFIVGVPRSGTTLLHRVLARDTDRFTTFTLWELLIAPSISERVFWQTIGRFDRLLGGLGKRLVSWAERSLLGSLDSIHASALTAPEEDYFALTPAFACFLLILPFPNAGKLWQLACFDDRLPDAERRRIMAFYRSCLQRHLYVHGTEKTLLSKNPSFTSAIGSLREAFPDCHVICNVRTPLEAIPSLLSSMREGTRLFYGARHEDILRDRFLGILNHYYRHSIDTLSVWPQRQHAFVTLEELERQLRPTVEAIYRRFGFDLSDAYRERLEEEHRRALAYRSRHRYSLEQFDLEPHLVYEDLAYVFERFDFPTPAGQPRELAG